MPKFVIEIRNRNFKRIGVVESYTSFEAILRYCDVGTWTLVLDAGLPETALLVEGSGIIVWVNGHDQPLFSGPLKSIKRQWGMDTPKGVITYAGTSDEQWLWERVIYPVPTSPLGSQTNDRISGDLTAGAALGYFVAYNMGEEAQPDRIHPYLTVDNSNAGPVVHVSARFDVLGKYLKEIALSSGYGFRVIQEGDGIRFAIFKPENRTGQAVFSPELGNILDYEYTVTAPVATNVILAAQGEGKDRWLKEYVGGPGEAELVNNTDGRISYTGLGWSLVSAATSDYEGNRHQTTNLDAAAQMTFTGTGIGYHGWKHHLGGLTEIWLDGVRQTTISTYSPDVQYQARLWERTDLSPGTHTIKIVNKVHDRYTVLDFFKVFPNPSTSSSTDWNSLAPEQFFDRRDIPIARSAGGSPINPETSGAASSEVLLQLDQAGYEALLEVAGTGSLTINPIDTEAIMYGRDYGLGDVVTVAVGGVVMQDVLREVRFSDSIQEGPVIKPIVGSEGASETPYLYQKTRILEDRLRKLEART